MARLKNLLFIILGTTFVSVSSSSRPRIFLDDNEEAPEEITVPAGGNISLTCRDVQPVQWRLHHNLNVSNAIDCEDQDHEELPYCVSITITNINYTDVGFFPCVHNTSSNWVETYQYHPDFEDAQAVYVFVKDEDNLLVETHLVIHGETNKPLIVPCKPTFPDVQVNISKMNDADVHNFLKLNSYKYYPWYGFHTPRAVVKKHQGTIVCRGTYNNQTTESNILISLIATDVIPEKPILYISTSMVWQHFDNEYDIIEGSSINITCTTEEQKSPLFFVHPPTANLTGQHAVHRYVREDAQIRIYMLPNADPEKDSGNYGCYAQKHSKKSENASITLNILSKGSPQLFLKMKDHEEDYEEKEISIIFTFRAYPWPKFTWKKTQIIDGNTLEETIHEGIDTYQTSKYEFDIHQKIGEVILTLKDVSWDTIGNYSLQAELPKSDHIASVNFTVNATGFGTSPQEISIKGSVFKFLKQNETFLIKCSARGYPPPKLSLEFQSCMPKCGEFIDVSHTSENNESVHDTSSDGPLVKDRKTSWSGKALSQGYYRCKATNYHGTNVTNAKSFLLTDPKAQKDINTLLWKSYEPLRKANMGNAVDDAFSPVGDTSMYTDGGKAAQRLEQEVVDGRVLKQKNYFSLFNPRHREEALMIFEVLMNCKAWAPCVTNNAAYFRDKMNEGVFIYAFYVAVIHHPIADGLILPPLYEVTPHMFTNSEVINQAYTAKMTATPGKFTMGYTGSQRNPEQRVAYFGEDIGMNVHHVSWHMDFPFWWKDSYGYNLDRKGELFFWAHHQLSARFDAERLSNNLDVVDELYWDRPIYEGFAPHTTYKYGGEFPARPDNIRFEDVDGIARIRDLMIWEDRIRDAIAHGYVTATDGTIINILNDGGIDVIGNLIESSTYSANPVYYGALHNTAHIVLGRQGDPKGKFKQPPGVMEHFETATRDPSFFRLHKYMNNIFKEFKDRLPPYTFDELNFEGVSIESVSIEGSLETYFEDFEFDLTNAVDDTAELEDVAISATVKRLNHKPFSFVLNINNNNGAEVTASGRLYLCPRRDNNGVAFHPNVGRWGCIEMDKFWVNLAPGANTVVRKSSESAVTVPDIPGFSQIIEKTEAAVAAGSDTHGMEDLSRTCGIPDRLLLPKGKEEGLEMVLMSFVSDGATDHTDTFQVGGHYGGTHAHCGIHGQKYPDKRAMGFPIDRQILDFRMTGTVTNFKNTIVQVYHKKSE